MKTHMKKLISKTMYAVAVLSLLCTVTFPTMLYCNDAPVTSDTVDTTDVIDRAVGAMGEGEEMLVRISMGAFPIAIILVFLLLLFVRDTRKISGLFYTLFVIIGATVGILLTHSGFVLDAVKQLIGII